jgi:outer membrane protein
MIGMSAMAVAYAEDSPSPWSMRVGVGYVAFNESAKIKVAGAQVPGGNLHADNNTILGLELGYALNENWTARLAVGVPPTTKLSTAGSLNALVPPLTGKLGEVTYGPAVLSGTYTFNQFRSFKPYIGAGVNYTLVLHEKDGDVHNLHIKSAFGAALEGGFDWQLSDAWGVFFDVRKVFVKTTADGTVPALGNPPAKADITLNPTIFHMGLQRRF